ncbi:T9SS type A sorting domain-containing protein, partial [Cryomorphaceae bacterium 1068]|nr:T9SS type A sorting domain-containing protein [Cryomorphaceae bacterium 1068]
AIMKDSLRFKQWILVFSMVMVIAITSAQNLIPNGGFEEGITCPSFVGNVTEECANWYGSLLNNEDDDPTPDWFHTCAEFESLTPPEVAFGYQNTYEGNGYAGIVTYGTNDSDYRETIAVQLLENLIVGQTYLVEFKISSLPNNDIGIGTNNIGYNFSTHPYYLVQNFPINSSHFNIDTVIPLSDSWYSVSEVFIADSTYSYFHLGNFFDASSINTEFGSPNSFMGYYVIDNVSITPILSNSLESFQHFKLYPNPARSILTIENLQNSTNISEIAVLKINGTRVERFNFSQRNIQYELDISSLSQGLYILQIITPKTMYYEKFIKA